MEKENSISQIEQALDLAFGALLAGDAQSLATHADAVLAGCQKLAAEPVIGAGRSATWPASARRVRWLREAIARQQVLNEMKLQQLVPAFQQPTYGSGAVASARPASPYGGVARASGRLDQVLRA